MSIQAIQDSGLKAFASPSQSQIGTDCVYTAIQLGLIKEGRQLLQADHPPEA